jgi:hypothetical protein
MVNLRRETNGLYISQLALYYIAVTTPAIFLSGDKLNLVEQISRVGTVSEIFIFPLLFPVPNPEKEPTELRNQTSEVVARLAFPAFPSEKPGADIWWVAIRDAKLRRGGRISAMF